MPSPSISAANSSKILTLSALALAITLPMAVPTTSYAQPAQSQQQQQYQIPAGSLEQALNTLGRQAGIVLMFSSELVSGKNSEGLNGQFTPNQALEHLLIGSGLMATSQTGGGYSIVPEQQGVMTLPALTVSGSTMTVATTEATGSYTTDSMNTATRLGLSIRETPQSVSVISRQMIDDMGLESISDLINTTIGVSSKAQDSTRNLFSARGFDIDNLQIDGVATTWSPGYSAGETLTDTLIYDRVEIVRGASGLISGAGNPSAAINLVRKKADSKEFTGHASVSAGSWDHYQGVVDLSTPLNKEGTVRGRVVGSYTDERSFIDMLENEKSVFYGTLAADLTDSTLLNIGVSYQNNSPRGSMWGGLPAWFSDGTRTNWSRSKTSGVDWATWSSDNTNYFANIEHLFDSGAKIYANYTKGIQNADLRVLYPSGLPDINTGEGINAFIGWYDYKREQDTFDFYGSAPFTFAGRNHEVILGLMHSEQDFLADTRSPLSSPPYGNFYNWDGSDYAEPQWGEKTTYTTQKTKQLGGYAVARLTLAEDLKLILGARMTSWEIEGMKWNGGRYNFDHKKVVTPYAGLIYDINDVYSAYVSYTNIFNPQDYQDKNGNYLDPLEGNNYETGLKAEYFEGRLNAMLSLFRIEQDNLAQTDGNNLIPGTINQAYYAAEGTTSQGFELEVSGAITDYWNLMAGWSQFRAEDADGAAVNTSHPRRTATLFSTYQLNQLTLGGGVNWESANYTMATNPLGQEEKLQQNSYSLVRVMVRYQMTSELSAQLNINNLFDEKYYTNSGASFRQLAYGAPRNANLTLKYAF